MYSLRWLFSFLFPRSFLESSFSVEILNLHLQFCREVEALIKAQNSNTNILYFT